MTRNSENLISLITFFTVPLKHIFIPADLLFLRRTPLILRRQSKYSNEVLADFSVDLSRSRILISLHASISLRRRRHFSPRLQRLARFCGGRGCSGGASRARNTPDTDVTVDALGNIDRLVGRPRRSNLHARTHGTNETTLAASSVAVLRTTISTTVVSLCIRLRRHHHHQR